MLMKLIPANDLNPKTNTSLVNWTFRKTEKSLRVVFGILSCVGSVLVSLKKRTNMKDKQPTTVKRMNDPRNETNCTICAPMEGAIMGPTPPMIDTMAMAVSLVLPGNASLIMARVTAVEAPAPIACRIRAAINW